MSYDLNVYGAEALDGGELRQIAELNSSVVVELDELGADVVAVNDRRTTRHAFSIDGPFRLEPGDVQDRLSPPTRARYLYSIVVAQSTAQYVEAAKTFAGQLAARIDGHVVDPQDDVTPVAPPSESRADGSTRLHLSWFRMRDGAADLAHTYIKAADELFPAAVPSRFGVHEPLQGKMSRGRYGEFDSMYRERCAVGNLLFTGKAIEYGQIWGWTNVLRSRYQIARIALNYEATRAMDAEDRLVEFFLRISRETSCFFAFAELNRSRLRTAAWGPFDGAWSGLPSTPQWMTWYSPAYANLVGPYLTKGKTSDFKEGRLHRWTARPAEAAQLASLIQREPWAGGHLLPTVRPGFADQVLRPAEVMPEELRYPPPGSDEAKRIDAAIARNRARETRM